MTDRISELVATLNQSAATCEGYADDEAADAGMSRYWRQLAETIRQTASDIEARAVGEQASADGEAK
jgi:hypothetical protein